MPESDLKLVCQSIPVSSSGTVSTQANAILKGLTGDDVQFDIQPGGTLPTLYAPTYTQSLNTLTFNKSTKNGSFGSKTRLIVDGIEYTSPYTIQQSDEGKAAVIRTVEQYFNDGDTPITLHYTVIPTGAGTIDVTIDLQNFDSGASNPTTRLLLVLPGVSNSWGNINSYKYRIYQLGHKSGSTFTVTSQITNIPPLYSTTGTGGYSSNTDFITIAMTQDVVPASIEPLNDGDYVDINTIPSGVYYLLHTIPDGGNFQLLPSSTGQVAVRNASSELLQLENLTAVYPTTQYTSKNSFSKPQTSRFGTANHADIYLHVNIDLRK